jgi:hypothetical protein
LNFYLTLSPLLGWQTADLEIRKQKEVLKVLTLIMVEMEDGLEISYFIPPYSMIERLIV